MTGLPGSAAGRYGTVFDEVAAEYDKHRPAYPDELVDQACQAAGIGSGDHVLEVGCGSGQLTRSLAARGLHVTALEPGENRIPKVIVRVEPVTPRAAFPVVLGGPAASSQADAASLLDRLAEAEGALAACQPGFHHDRGQRVAEQVVQVASDPDPLVFRGEPGQFGAGLGERCVVPRLTSWV